MFTLMILLFKFVYEDAREVDYGTALCVLVQCGRGYSGHIKNYQFKMNDA